MQWLKHREVKRKVKTVGHRQGPQHPCVQWRKSVGQNDSPGQNETCHHPVVSHEIVLWKAVGLGLSSYKILNFVFLNGSKH